VHHYDAVVYGPGHLERWGPIGDAADRAARPRIQGLGFDDVWQRLLRANRRALRRAGRPPSTPPSPSNWSSRVKPAPWFPNASPARRAVRGGSV
jgi:hypothetical protein